MTKEIAIAQPKSNIVMPVVQLNEADIKRHIAPTATDKELYMFMEICRSYGLNPFKREVHFVKYGSSPGATIVGYEAYIKRAESTMLLDGWEVSLGKDDLGEKAIITIHRKDRSKPFVWTVYRHEFDTKQANWQKMPLFMLRKVAISQGFRLAFPVEIGGMPYIPEEIGNNKTTSEELPKDEVLEGEVIHDAPQQNDFTAPVGMDEISEPESLGPTPIDVEAYAQHLKQVANADKLKAEYDSPTFQDRLGVSDAEAVNSLYKNRLAALQAKK